MAPEPDAGAVSHFARERDGTPVHRRIRGHARRRDLSMRWLRQSAFRRGDEVRIGQRLAQFLRTAGERRRRNRNRPETWDDPNGSALLEMRRTSRPCFPGRSRADWTSLLHELLRDEAGEERVGEDAAALLFVGRDSVEPRLAPTRFGSTASRPTERPHPGYFMYLVCSRAGSPECPLRN